MSDLFQISTPAGFVAAVIVLCVLLAIVAGYEQANAAPESDIAACWCKAAGGESEHRTRAGTRVDCLTATHAVEVERAHRWAEGIGQALHYAAETERAAGIVLIVEEPGERRFLARLESTIAAHGLAIQVWPLAVDMECER